MQSAGSAPQRNAETAMPDAAELICHLTHELRQPLSGIESAAYYLDMVVSEARPDLIPHCRRLRAMVQHANWLLDDAALCAMFQPSAAACSLAAVFEELGRRMLAEDEAVLDLHLECEGWVAAPGLLPRLAGHLVAFFRDVAGCHDPIHAGVREGGPGWVAARIWAGGCEDARDAARMLKAAGECGFLGRFLAAAGGGFEVQAEESAQRLTLTLRLPAAEQGG